MFAIYKREMKSYFYSPIAYVLVGIFALISSVMFFLNVSSGTAEINPTLELMCFILIFVIPILTMKLIAEDRKTGVDVLLLSSPVDIHKIVLGKFFAAFTVFAVMVAFSFIFPIILFIYAEPTVSQVIGSYIGYLLMGAAFVSIGVFASALSSSQIIAAVVGFLISLAMLFMNIIAQLADGVLATALQWISLMARYEGFVDGRVELSAVVYYISFTALMLFLAVRLIEKRRWS